jgi:hypothetical protein
MFEKSQFVRLLDVFALGPFMVYFAHKVSNVTVTQKAIIAASGVTTILYNGQNYLGNTGVRIPPAGNLIYSVIWVSCFMYFYSTMEQNETTGTDI